MFLDVERAGGDGWSAVVLFDFAGWNGIMKCRGVKEGHGRRI